MLKTAEEAQVEEVSGCKSFVLTWCPFLFRQLVMLCSQQLQKLSKNGSALSTRKVCAPVLRWCQTFSYGYKIRHALFMHGVVTCTLPYMCTFTWCILMFRSTQSEMLQFACLVPLAHGCDLIQSQGDFHRSFSQPLPLDHQAGRVIISLLITVMNIGFIWWYVSRASMNIT